MKSDFDRIKGLMETAVEDGVFPSGALLVAKGGGVVFSGHFGACSEAAIFDTASLTKPVVTATLSMIAVSEGILNLAEPVAKFFPGADRLKNATVANLLNHSSGLPAWEPYYQEVPLGDVASASGRMQIIDTVLNEQPEYEAGTRSLYSDLGFILLGGILEKVFSKDICLLAEEMIAKPLGLASTFYRPVTATPWSGKDFVPAFKSGGRDFGGCEFVPTEDCPWRGQVVSGVVHDQNCYAMGGVAGHAGLFSTVSDLHKFVLGFTANMKGEEIFAKKDVIVEFADAYTSSLAFHHPGTFLLGWDRPSHKNSQAGHYFPRRSIGHLGYTGCSLWIDMENGFWVILLTNRIYPSSTNQKIKSFRPLLHDEIRKIAGLEF